MADEKFDDDGCSSSTMRRDEGALAEAQSPHLLEEALLGDSDPEDGGRSAEAREARRNAAEKITLLRNTCEWGLGVVRLLMGYLLCVSASVACATGACEWIIVESRRGSLEVDWWKCLCDDGLVAHWVDSQQKQKIPGVLAATMVQSAILAWVALVLTQRACIRMDWISSAIVNVSFTALLIALPPFTAAWPAPTAIASSLVSLCAWTFRARPFGAVAEPNDCGKAHAFMVLCVGLTAATLLCNVGALAFLLKAECRRRAAVEAEDAALALEGEAEAPAPRRRRRGSSSDESIDAPAPLDRLSAGSANPLRLPSGLTPSPAKKGAGGGGPRRPPGRLEHRLYCCVAAPRTITLGSVMVLAYAACAVSRCCLSILSQRAFDAALFGDHNVLGVDVPGTASYVAAAPGMAIGAGAAFTSFSSLLRGFAAEDLANFRIAFLLGALALFVDLPTLAATVHGGLQHDLFTVDASRCVDGYMLGDAHDVYGYPTRGKARKLCVALYVDLWATVVHVVAVFFMTVSAARTFTYNNRPLAAAVEPPPGALEAAPEPRRAMHLLHTADECTFEYDVRWPSPRPLPGAQLRGSATAPDARYSALVIRPRDSAVATERARRTGRHTLHDPAVLRRSASG